jgi:hypothetical protein
VNPIERKSAIVGIRTLAEVATGQMRLAQAEDDVVDDI